MLKHTEVKKGKVVILKKDPYEVISHSHNVKGRGKSVVRAQLKNLKTGSITQKTFRREDEIEEAELEKLEAFFIYSHRGKYVFHKKGDPSFRFTLTEKEIEKKADYLIEDTSASAVIFKGKILGISLPVKVSLRVKEAPPGIKGNRAEGGTKTVTLETGKTVETPLFVGEGDLLEINTETGEYVRRIKKA